MVAKIAIDIKIDLQSLGSHIETMETKINITIAHANQNTDHIQDLHNQLEVANVDDLENWSRRYNFRV